MEVQHFSYEHTLTFYEKSGEKLDEIKPPTCHGCLQIISDPAYFCKTCCSNFWLHKSCIQLPTEISNPLYPSQPLILATSPNFSELFICDECRDVSSGFLFSCDACNFNLDVKCAILTGCDDLRSRKNTDTKTNIYHFTHSHQLFDCNTSKELEINCSVCDQLLCGPAYGCLKCKFFLHRSCKEMPREIQHHYHPLHPLRAEVNNGHDLCDACITQAGRILYRCSECEYKLDLLCANNSLGIRSALRHKCHEHELYYFLSNDSKEFTFCYVCKEICKGPCFFCVKFFCVYFHFECIQLPQTAKHDDHFHPLTLVESFLEDDSGSTIVMFVRNGGTQIFLFITVRSAQIISHSLLILSVSHLRLQLRNHKLIRHHHARRLIEASWKNN